MVNRIIPGAMMDNRTIDQIGPFARAGNFLTQMLCMACIAVVYGGYATKKPCRSKDKVKGE